MMFDHNSSDLAPQRQEMSIENVTSGLVPQGQKASDYDNSDPVPPRQNVVPTAEKTDSSHQGLEFLYTVFSNLSDVRENEQFLMVPLKSEVCVASARKGSLTRSSRKVSTLLRKVLVWIKSKLKLQELHYSDADHVGFIDSRKSTSGG
ncbi:hypothetical protein Tco_1202771 [Tanacetum coccineum]